MNIEVYRKVILFCSLLALARVNAQTWTQKADFGGSGRYSSSGFSVSNKGYIGFGWDTALSYKNDLWEYDSENNLWKHEADFIESTFWYSVGFSIGNIGFIATDHPRGFWEYDPSTNTWTEKTDYPGPIVYSVAFSIGTKGYITTGEYSRELWEWDGDTASATYNTWTQKASLPGLARSFAVGFSIGTHGYIGTGLNGWINILLTDLWRWDQATDTWTQMPDLPGPARESAIAISIGNNGYVGTGYGDGYANLKDFWEFCDTCHVGTKEIFPNQNLSIYPNPANNYIRIMNSNENTNSKVEIIDIYGSLLFCKAFKGNFEIDISSLKAGFYVIKIKDYNKIYSTKLIIER